jgi:hypothetical protein
LPQFDLYISHEKSYNKNTLIQKPSKRKREMSGFKNLKMVQLLRRRHDV